MKHFKSDSLAETAKVGVRERVPYWDNAKLLLIFFVVLGHVLLCREDLALPKLLSLGIYSFHMPAFALVSGYFSFGERSRSKEKIVPLLAAYVTFNGFFVLYSYLARSDIFFTIPYYSMWYLLALVFWRITVAQVAKVPLSLLWTTAAAVGIGFWADADNYFAVSRIVAFYPFFLAGYLAREKGLGERILGMRAPVKAIIALILWAALAGGFILTNRYLHFTDDQVLFAPFERLYDVVPRLVLLALAVVGTGAVLMSAPRKRLPLLTALGANTLAIYLLHRYLVLGFQKFAADRFDELAFLGVALGVTIVLLVLCGNPLMSGLVSRYLDAASSLVLREERRGGVVNVAFKVLCVALVAAVAVVPALDMRRGDATSSAKTYEEQPRMSAQEEAAARDAFTILFAGDLTLLEDQVRAGYTGQGYDYAPVFEYTKPYISEADLAIGVFEGPCAGAEAGYSSGNFSDSKPFWLNFPDEFAAAVKDAGFDFVTNATNHILDRGVAGAVRTLDVLDGLGLGHVGAYRDQAEKEAARVRIVEQGGLKIALLAYTYGVNDDLSQHPDEAFVSGEYAGVTSVIVEETSPSFAAVRAEVAADFARAKQEGADLIVVLPHWGTQFTNEPDEFQKTWRSIFLAEGADIILGAHSHDVQPIVVEEVAGKRTLTCYCPGNYCDLYREYDGDCSALVEVKVDRASKEIIGGSIIPLWTESQLDGNYRAVPVGEIVANNTLRSQLTNYDLLRVDEVQQLATRVMLGRELDLQTARVRQPFDAEGHYVRASVPQLELTDAERAGTLASALTSGGDVCFVGDFATAGSNNGGYGWYEPLESQVSGRVTRIADGAATARGLTARAEELVAARSGLYVVAVGTNDVRYRGDASAAQTAQEYVASLGELVAAVRAGVPEARFLFVAPWTSVSGDTGTTLMLDEKRALNAEYAEALKAWCAAEGHAFINPNPAIEAVIDLYPDTRYLVDAKQPNATRGIELYARAAVGA